MPSTGAISEYSPIQVRSIADPRKSFEDPIVINDDDDVSPPSSCPLLYAFLDVSASKRRLFLDHDSRLLVPLRKKDHHIQV